MYKPISVNDVQSTNIIRNTNDEHINSGDKIESVTVIAPTNLPGGYKLVIDTNGSFWTVQVPDGGVSMNESFQAVVLHKTQVAKAELVGSSEGTNSNNTNGLSRTKLNFHIPTGRWRDGIFDCFIIEPIHSQCCLTYYFPYIALGQIMTRLNLNVCGQRSNIPRSEQGYCRPFYLMCIIAFIFWFLYFINIQALQTGIATSGSPEQIAFHPGFLSIVVIYAVVIYMIIVHTETRNKLRRKYRIGTNKSCLGDCCCATFCTACSICQMARHTAEYHHTHRARCCTETGLDEEWDEYDYEASIEGTTSQSTPFIV